MKLKVIKNCYCSKCKKNNTERIKVFGLGYTGIICNCGNKKKANLKEIEPFNYYNNLTLI